MANILPPAPMGTPPGSSYWNDWYEKVRSLINKGSISVLWSNINFGGSTLTSIVNRAHNNLQTIQGGTANEYYHLTAAQSAAVIGSLTHNNLLSLQGGTTGEYYHLTLAQQTKVAALPTGISATINTTKLTTGGVNGSMTFVNGLLTAQTQAT